MAKSPTKKAPSRVRYEQAHPTVSCRVSRELYDRLKAARKREARSFADILKIGLGVLEVQAKKESEVRKRARAAGYREGYAAAERLYEVIIPCAICGEMMAITGPQAKEAVKKYMREHGWGHSACYKRRR